jgi:hypothetical protein
MPSLSPLGQPEGDQDYAALYKQQCQFGRRHLAQMPARAARSNPWTLDVVHNKYIRRVELVNGQRSNVEFETYSMVKDP